MRGRRKVRDMELWEASEMHMSREAPWMEGIEYHGAKTGGRVGEVKVCLSHLRKTLVISANNAVVKRCSGNGK